MHRRRILLKRLWILEILLGRRQDKVIKYFLIRNTIQQLHEIYGECKGYFSIEIVFFYGANL